MDDGARTQPSLDKTEHVSENISAKRVVPYYWDGTNLVREGTALTERYDYSDSSTIYVGQAPIGSATSADVWTIFKYDLTDPSNAEGLVATSAIWNDRTSGTYN